MDPETCRSAVELIGRAEQVEKPAEMKACLRSVRRDELRGGRP